MNPITEYRKALRDGPSSELEFFISNADCEKTFSLTTESMTLNVNAATLALVYAINILKGPFRNGERQIASDTWMAYKYARSCLKNQFPLGEPAITKMTPFSLDYQFRFNRDICPLEQLTDYPAYALSYAIMIGSRFPEGEPAMEKSPRIWNRYKEFLKEL